MLISKRRRLVGFLIAIITPAVIGAIAMPANGLVLSDPAISLTCTDVPNLVANCGFEASATNPVPHWTHLVSHYGYVSSSVVHSGARSIDLGSSSGDDVFIQTVPVAPHTKYLVGAWIFTVSGGSTPNNDFTLAATNINNSPDATTIYSNTNVPDGGWQQIGDVVTTAGGRTMTLVIHGANGPGHTYVDDVSVTPVPAGCAAVANNLVRNCGFEASTTSPWVHSGTTHNSTVSAGSSYGGADSLRFGATPPNEDVWYQVISVRPHTQYTLSYYVEYWSRDQVPNNNLHVMVSNVPAAIGGVLKITTVNAPNRFWSKVTRTFTTGSGTTARVTIAGANDPNWTYVDDVSVTAVPHIRVSARGSALTTTLTGLGGQKVFVELFTNRHWVVSRTLTAPTTGWSKSWTFAVGAGLWRAVAAPAPGYSAAVSSAITVR